MYFGDNLIGGVNGLDSTDLADIFAAVQTYNLTGLSGGELADNGGNVWTMALKLAAANPALDGAQIIELVEADLGLEFSNNGNLNQVVNEALVRFDANGDGDTSDLLTGFDARGVARAIDVPSAPDDGAKTTDIGAFELEPSAPTDLDLTNVNSVDENDAAGVDIGDVTVVDEDTANIDDFTFTLSDDRFEVVGNKLQLKSGQTLDYEVDGANFRLTITVTDPDNQSYSETFNIVVNNVDDEDPEISAQTLSYDENQSSGDVLGIVRASDDVGVTSFAITNGIGLFAIDNQGRISLTDAGAVSVANDFEFGDNEFVLTVEATDGEGNTADAQITLTVNDVDENDPVILDQDLSYDENQVSGSTLVTVSANDDVAVTGFAITAGNNAGLFAIDDQGRITLTDTGVTSAANDYETGDNEFVLTVEATDGEGNTADAQITLTVNDVDENDPVILDQDLSYDENQVSGSTLVTVSANDDVAVTGFAITAGNNAGLFAIDDQGRITLTDTGVTSAANDYETGDNEFVLTVEATDGEGNTADAQITLTVNDVDENDPVILDQDLSYDENQVSGSTLVTVSANDDVAVTGFAITAGNNAGLFAIDDQGRITLTDTGVTSAANDYETGDNEFVLTVEVTDDSGKSSSAIVTLTVNDVNEAPTTVGLTNVRFVLPEDFDTGSGVKIADIVVTDDNLGTNTLSLSGADAAAFEIIGTELYLKAGTALDFSTKAQFDVRVEVDDATVGLTPDATTDFSLYITEATGNAAPTAVSLTNVRLSLAENSDTSDRVHVADIVVTDDNLGTNNLSLSGADADFFEIDGMELYLKADTLLDFEAKTQFQVMVEVDDPDVGPTPDATTNYSLQVTDVAENTPPTSVSLTNVRFVLPEDFDTGPGVKIADIVVTDDGVGINNLSLSGADADSFEIIGTELYLKAGTALDFSTKAQFDVRVEVDDATVGLTPDATTDFSLYITEAAGNAAPTAVSLTNVRVSLAENSDTSTRVHVADIVVTDDNLGTNNLSLSGADADLFEIDGMELYLKADTVLDFEAKTKFQVTVEVDDPDVGPTPDANTAFTLEITNQPITDIEIESGGSVDENSAPDTVVAIFQASENPVEPLAQFRLIDDAGGLFYLDGNTLRVADGAQLDFESATQHTVVIGATDGTGPEISETFNIQINDVLGREIIGTPLPDALEGTPENDSIWGLASDDRILASLGSDSINGGSGTDTVVYDGNRSDYEVTLLPDGRVTVLKPDGSTDTLTSIERVDLADGDYVYDIYGPNAEFGYLIYQASFGRIPDEAGVRYRVGILDDLDEAGWSEYQKEQFLARQFIESVEFKLLYGTNLTDEDYIDAMYQNVLGRLPDQAGYDFWVGELDLGFTREHILVAFTESEENGIRTADNVDDGFWVV